MLISRFVAAQSLKEQSADAQSSQRIANLGIKIEAATLHFDDVVTFNCALCNLIAHLTFEIRKVLEKNKPQDVLHHGAWMAVHETTKRSGVYTNVISRVIKVKLT